MTSRETRLAFILGVAALVAVAVGSSMAPALRAAPAPKTDFAIWAEVEGDYYDWPYWTGTWRARGALNVSGAPALYDLGTLYLDSPDPDPSGAGSMRVEFGSETYVIVEATGVYAPLQDATGPYTSNWVSNCDKKTGLCTGKGSYKLTGSIPE